MNHDETAILKEYWEHVQDTWTPSTYKKSLVYTITKERLLACLNCSTVHHSLEIGFGDGRWLTFLHSQGVAAYGLDIVKKAASRVKRKGFSPVVADARYIPFKSNTFDLVYSFGVIEHFNRTEIAIQEHIRVTKKGGRIIITVPHLFSPYTVYWALRHIKEGTFQERPATFGKRYTKPQLKKMMSQYNTDIVRLDSFSCPVPKLKFHHAILEQVGVMLWIEMIKK